MAVPPVARRSPTHFFARTTCVLSAARRPSAYQFTVVAKFITAKRSFGPRLSRQNFSAFFACSIFTPCMLPDVSRTKTMSRGTSCAFDSSARGDASSMKQPSSPATGRYVTAVKPTSLSPSVQNSEKSLSSAACSFSNATVISWSPAGLTVTAWVGL